MHRWTKYETGFVSLSTAPPNDVCFKNASQGIAFNALRWKRVTSTAVVQHRLYGSVLKRQ